MLKKITDWYKSQSSTTKGLIWLGVILVIGIIIRWNWVIDGITKGFNFYNVK